ncbi:hypothetical protein RJ639_038090 [Escallonia herrerae]|uniref:U-box domain-containing protein n=1 Tax=Escallonia herrerae TaxID=1293975 RepID=A0AA88WLD2_9ASTE|nr:hypothetical protein RJ639_038090 [Escallonia herrerae]
MTDPVILSSGHTFDRPSIQQWLDSGYRTLQSPCQTPPSLIPNHTLRSLISNYVAASLPKPQLKTNPETQLPQSLEPVKLVTSVLPEKSSDVVGACGGVGGVGLVEESNRRNSRMEVNETLEKRQLRVMIIPPMYLSIKMKSGLANAAE